MGRLHPQSCRGALFRRLPSPFLRGRERRPAVAIALRLERLVRGVARRRGVKALLHFE